ncbi:MAG TPA: family 16 glycoside hydrolase [Bryobacteraceae bacterium]|nr:family 16 glycoside hydrolase [Bryobacteraceae bacterium]
MHTTKLSLILAAPLGMAALLYGAKGVDLKPALTSPGKLVFEDNFSSGSLAKPWTAAKGEWQVRDGVLTGKEKKEDKHNAVLNLAQPNRNSVIQTSFKLDGAKLFHLSYNHAKGHLFRVIVVPTGISINKDKDVSDPQSKGGVLAKSDTKFEPGKWYTLMVEVQGDKVTVQTDNGVKLSARDAALDRDKINYRFVTAGETLSISGVKVWKAGE